MFIGLTASSTTSKVCDYPSAVKAYQQARLTPVRKSPRTADREGYFPLSTNTRGPRKTKMLEDGSVAFCLYDTDVVTWHPDNSVSIENWGSATTSAFARDFLPAGFRLYHTSTRFGEESGHKGIEFPTADTDWHICFGELVRFRPDGSGYAPDLDDCDELTFPVLDRAKARAVAARYHLRDFEAFLRMGPRMLQIDHIRWCNDTCAEALEARDFVTAAKHLPTTDSNKSSFGRDPKQACLGLRCSRRWEVVTMGSLAKIKEYLWLDNGALDDETFQVLPVADFERKMARVRRLRRLSYAHCYGPS